MKYISVSMSFHVSNASFPFHFWRSSFCVSKHSISVNRWTVDHRWLIRTIWRLSAKKSMTITTNRRWNFSKTSGKSGTTLKSSWRVRENGHFEVCLFFCLHLRVIVTFFVHLLQLAWKVYRSPVKWRIFVPRKCTTSKCVATASAAPSTRRIGSRQYVIRHTCWYGPNCPGTRIGRQRWLELHRAPIRWTCAFSANMTWLKSLRTTAFYFHRKIRTETSMIKLWEASKHLPRFLEIVFEISPIRLQWWTKCDLFGVFFCFGRKI